MYFSAKGVYLSLIMMQEQPLLHLVEAHIFQRNSRREILRGVNLYAYSGELIYLIGRVGSGKSSLLKTLYGELPLRIGRGKVAGYALQTLTQKQVPYLRRKLGIVFQDVILLEECTVYQNLEFVLRATDWRNSKAINNRIGAVLSMTNMTHKAHSYPHQLSGGERQRTGISRALLNNPQIVLADEPTANLDPNSTAEVMELFRSIANQGCSVIISTHNMSNILQYPGRNWLLENGYVRECDSDEL